MSTKTNRRKFLTTAALATTAYSTSQVMGANEKIRMGFIGLGGRGMGSANWFDEIEDVEVAALCDVDTKTLARAQQAFPKASSTQDLRRLIEDPEIDAVCVSTCNHWHVLASIWAMEAGKDVYVEKPVSHNVWEGRQLVAAARKYDRMCQGGTQQRSDEFQAELREFLNNGDVIGKMKYARLNRYGMRASIGKLDKPLVPPETVDYDLWLGPAQDIPIYRPKLHYDWHWNWNTGNGDLGNWGPHITDDLRNVVFGDRVKLPTRVMSGGGRLAWDDAGESPNTHFTYFDTEEIPVIFDVHNLPKAKGVKGGDYYARRRTNAFLVVECEGGYYAGGRGGGVAYDARATLERGMLATSSKPCAIVVASTSRLRSKRFIIPALGATSAMSLGESPRLAITSGPRPSRSSTTVHGMMSSMISTNTAKPTKSISARKMYGSAPCSKWTRTRRPSSARTRLPKDTRCRSLHKGFGQMPMCSN